MSRLRLSWNVSSSRMLCRQRPRSATAAGNARSAATVADKLFKPPDCPAGRRLGAAALWLAIQNLSIANKSSSERVWRKTRQSATKRSTEMDGAPENSRHAINLSNSKREAQVKGERVTGTDGKRVESKKPQRPQLGIRQTERRQARSHTIRQSARMQSKRQCMSRTKPVPPPHILSRVI